MIEFAFVSTMEGIECTATLPCGCCSTFCLSSPVLQDAAQEERQDVGLTSLLMVVVNEFSVSHPREILILGIAAQLLKSTAVVDGWLTAVESWEELQRANAH